MIKAIYDQLRKGNVPCLAKYKKHEVYISKSEERKGFLVVEYYDINRDYVEHKVEYYVGENYDGVADRAEEIANDAQIIINDFI